MQLNLEPNVRTEISLQKRVILGATIVSCLTAAFFIIGNLVSEDSRAGSTGSPTTYNVSGNSQNSTNRNVWSVVTDGDTLEVTGQLKIKDDIDLSDVDVIIHVDGGELFWDDAYSLLLSDGSKLLISNVGELIGKSSKLDSDMDVYFDNVKVISWDGTNAFYSFDDINNSGGYDNGLVALPVDLISFETEAVQNGVALRWSTAAEINNSHFEVQRSQNGIDFITLETVQGHGNTSDRIDYTYLDDQIPATASVMYYRLKQVDFDGAFEILPVSVVRVDRMQQSAIVFPNPADKVLNVTREEVEFNAQILDRAGNIVDSQTSLNYKVQFDVTGVTDGIYFVNITTDEGQTETQRIIIRH